MRWHKLNYPNRHDAERGFSRGWLTAPVRDAIAKYQPLLTLHGLRLIYEKQSGKER